MAIHVTSLALCSNKTHTANSCAPTAVHQQLCTGTIVHLQSDRVLALSMKGCQGKRSYVFYPMAWGKGHHNSIIHCIDYVYHKLRILQNLPVAVGSRVIPPMSFPVLGTVYCMHHQGVGQSQPASTGVLPSY